jgi:hypothetical protein
MAARIDWSKKLTEAITESVNYRRTNPSRYTGNGYLKPICAPGEHSQFMDSVKCEVCGIVVEV